MVNKEIAYHGFIFKFQNEAKMELICVEEELLYLDV